LIVLNNPSLSPAVLPFVFVIVLIAVVVGILPYWKIFSKAGFSGWMSLLMLVPLLNVVVLYIVAFSQWNVQPTSFTQQVPPPPVLPKHPW
jgi:peptidoglycan biosynthesis protein MviN/MurJ (putative lipid II flippase)